MKTKCIVFILTLFLAGCGVFARVNIDTEEKQYLAARAELNLLLEQYLTIQYFVLDTDHERAKAAFVSADMALDTWELMMGNPAYNATADVRLWLEAKNIIIDVMRTVLK